MEWSLTQNKLLAFHRLMRTDKPIGALLLPGQHYGRCGWRHRAFPSSDPGGVCRGVWLMRAAGCVW